MSGIMTFPRSRKMASPVDVVGPLAPSAMSGALMRPAFSAVIWFCRAAGTRMSLSSSKQALASSRVVASGKPLRLRWAPPPLQHRLDVQPLRGVNRPVAFGQSHDDRAVFSVHQPGKVTAHTAKALHSNAFTSQVALQPRDFDQLGVTKEFP